MNLFWGLVCFIGALFVLNCIINSLRISLRGGGMVGTQLNMGGFNLILL